MLILYSLEPWDAERFSLRFKKIASKSLPSVCHKDVTIGLPFAAMSTLVAI